jgi:uncharacterized protein YoxC
MDRVEAALEVLTQNVTALTARVDALTSRVDELTTRVDALTSRVDALTTRVDALATRVDALTARLDEQADRFDALTARLDEQADRFDALTLRIDRLVETSENQNRQLGKYTNFDGRLLEAAYARNVLNWFPDWVQKPSIAHIVNEQAIDDALAAGTISETEVRDARRLDLLIVGQPLDGSPDRRFLGCEFSLTINEDDVSRADRRIQVLRRSGLDGVGLVGGHAISERAADMAARLGVLVDLREP